MGTAHATAKLAATLLAKAHEYHENGADAPASLCAHSAAILSVLSCLITSELADAQGDHELSRCALQAAEEALEAMQATERAE